jgi:hypothetical protein
MAIEIYTRISVATGKTDSGIRGYRNETRRLGTAYMHSEPQIGHVIIFDGETYRIKDVAHPTENDRADRPFYPRVLVEVEDVFWLEGTTA